MIKKSFFNPFSSLLLALAGLAFLVDVVPQAQGQTGAFAPAVLFLMWVGMFFVWDNPVSWVVALVVMAATYFVEVLIDNTFARSTWRSCFKLGWGVALVFGLLNLMPILVDVFI